MPGRADYRGKQLLAEEYFAAEDPRFLEALREVKAGQLLGPFAERWGADPRQWARDQLLHYLTMPPNVVGHQVVVKRLFKLAEQRGDDTLVGAFAVLFDRLVRHRRRLVTRSSWRPRRTWEEEILAAECPPLPGGAPRQGVNPFTGEPLVLHPPRPRPDAVYFTHATRYYLQRRAYRYFRHIGFRDPVRYLTGVSHLLARYEDEHLARGEYLLDSWTLMHVAFRHHPSLRFTRDRVRLAEGGNLANLSPAPAFPEHWQRDEAFDLLLSLLQTAASRLVRIWARQLLEREHAERLADMPISQVLGYLTSGQSELEEFALAIFKTSRSLGDLAPSQWLALLEGATPTTREAIVEAMRAHLPPERLTFDECLQLALAEPATVAQYGFDLLRDQTTSAPAELHRLADLADARCAALAGEMARWALEHMGGSNHYDREVVTPFFDSVTSSARQAAWEWLNQPDSPGRDDPVLFCRLMETPYSDLRLKIVDLLERRSLPGEARDGLELVWPQVLLGVERGGRQKLKATRQVAQAIVRDLASAERLLPVLVTAARSVRAPESRAGLAALVELMIEAPQLVPQVAEQLPELALPVAGGEP